VDIKFNVQRWAQKHSMAFSGFAVFTLLCNYWGSYGKPDAKKESKVKNNLNKCFIIYLIA